MKDPVILICSGIIFFGVLALIWAISRFRRIKEKPRPVVKMPKEDFPAPAAEKYGIDLGLPAMAAVIAPPPPPPPPPPAVSKEVADRLDSMTLRLAEMQAVLAKQATAAPGDPGAVGQGFSPETIDKLLKIIGNVVQQVDILQKNLNPGKEPSAPTAKP